MLGGTVRVTPVSTGEFTYEMIASWVGSDLVDLP